METALATPAGRSDVAAALAKVEQIMTRTLLPGLGF